MNIELKREGAELTVMLDGRLDTMTAPELDETLKAGLEGVELLIFDFEKLAYISSAGLRVLLGAHKSMSGHGSMKVIHVNEMITEIFDVTGFSDILTIE